MANRKILQLHFYEPWMLFEEKDLKALYGAFLDTTNCGKCNICEYFQLWRK